jgi:hypothetical protein
VPSDRYWLPLSKKPINTQKKNQKRTIQPGDALEDTASKSGFEIVKF